VYVACKYCGKEILLPVKSRTQLPLVFSVKCPFCGSESTYTPGHAREEGVVHFACKSCRARLFAVVESGCRLAECPLCKSVYRVCADGVVEAVELKEYVPLLALAATQLGMLAGATALGEKNEKEPSSKAKVKAGALVGLLAGALYGLVLESAIRAAEREVVYKS
jgi:hypothetical protein